MRCLQLLALMLLLDFSSMAFAHDVSVASGFYRSEKVDDGVSQSEISLGARYGFKTIADQQWFLRALVGSTSYSGDNAPDSSTSITVGGGRQYFLRSFSKDIHTYAAWEVGFTNSKTSTAPNNELTTNGLLYAGHVGFRFDLSSRLFFDMNAKLFESALLSTETTRNSTTTPATEQKTKRTEVYAKTAADVSSLLFGMGYIF